MYTVWCVYLMMRFPSGNDTSRFPFLYYAQNSKFYHIWHTTPCTCCRSKVASRLSNPLLIWNIWIWNVYESRLYLCCSLPKKTCATTTNMFLRKTFFWNVFRVNVSDYQGLNKILKQFKANGKISFTFFKFSVEQVPSSDPSHREWNSILGMHRKFLCPRRTKISFHSYKFVRHNNLND